MWDARHRITRTGSSLSVACQLAAAPKSKSIFDEIFSLAQNLHNSLSGPSKKMQLIDTIPPFSLKTTPAEQWLISGPAAWQWANLFGLTSPVESMQPGLAGILLAEVLSNRDDAATWLEQWLPTLDLGTRLVIIEWQADGPLEPGPSLERRFKRGRLCRLLREAGFGAIETLVNQTLGYIVQAYKEPISNQPPPPGEFIEVASLDELPKNAMKVVEVFDQTVIVANTGKEIVAFAQQCPHAEGRLNEGRLRGANVMCPVHYYIWNVQSGRPVEPTDEDILPRYPVRIDETTRKILIAPTDTIYT
jgi:nitrite reductase/ring-hydroxylating ferredoxin subunit